ncbi:MAG: helix-turn-helix domain-containing protein [Lachnospiraceae bacterium]|nr:helix-turn-helix domain-containing protein [Lachnospiraceae bacterium]
MIYTFDTPSDIAIKLAQKMKSIRKRRKITQKQLAARSNVSYATLRKFEKTGKISLESFIKISMELGLTSELNNLFSVPVYNSIEEVVNEQKQNP